jgi:lysophospholipase L1-like esterase
MKSPIRLKANDTILFIGDSITDAERHRRAYSPLGFGYVHFAAYALLSGHPNLDISIINAGVSGDTILDLQRRWQRDCLARGPNLLTVLVGINDVWRLTAEPAFAAGAAPPDLFEVTYNQLLSRTKEKCHAESVLMEPFLFCADRSNELYQALLPYVEIVRKLAAKHDAVLVPLQEQIERAMAQVPPERWSDDMVHPHLWAHAWIAQRWREALGF